MTVRVADCLHLYLGCEVMEEENKGTLYAIGKLGGDGKTRVMVDCSSNQSYWTSIDNVKPILRPLSDLTEEEIFELFKAHGLSKDARFIRGKADGITGNFIQIEYSINGEMGNDYLHINEFGRLSALGYTYLLKQKFDLFGLIESGAAVEKTK